MFRDTSEIEIHRSVEDVFPWLDDANKARQWLPGLQEIVPITEGGNRVGAKAKHVYVENDRRIEMIAETLVYEPNRHVKIHGVSDAFTITAEYTLTPKGNATVLELRGEVEFKSAPMRLMASLFVDAAKRREMETLQKLKSLVEAG